MGRNFKVIFLIITALVVTISFTFFRRDDGRIKVDIRANEVVIQNFEMAKVFDEKGNYYRVTSSVANIDKDENVAKLTDFQIEYKKDDTNFRAESGYGVIKQDVFVDVEGKITGAMNDLLFETSENGKFRYDFETENGVLEGDVLIRDGEKGNISADRALMYQRDNYVEFDGNVKVNYLH